MSQLRIPLSSVISIKHGYAFPGDGFGQDQGKPILVTPGNFAIGGGFKATKIKTFAGDYMNEYCLRPGDLIVTMTDLSRDGDTLGLPALVPGDGVYLHNQRIGLVEVNRPDLVSREFLAYFLRGDAYRAFILGTATGSTVRHTSPARIGSFIASLPTLNEQQAIAEVLGALDDKIAANTSLIGIADKLAAVLVESLIDPGKVVPLDQVATLTMGSSPAGPDLNESGEGTVFYQGVRDFGVRYPKERVWTTGPVRFAESQDSLVSVRAPVGEINLAAEHTCIGRGLASVRSTKGTPMTLFHLLRVLPEIWHPFQAEGTIFGSINRPQLAALPLPTVVESQVLPLEATLSALEGSISSALAESGLLSEVRDTLLPALMSGKLRVKDAEKQAEEVL